MDLIREDTPPAVLEAAREAARRDARADRSRGDDTGRTLTR